MRIGENVREKGSQERRKGRRVGREKNGMREEGS